MPRQPAEIVVLPKRCTARSKQSGEQCKKAPVSGGTVCASHGGSAPQVRAAAARNAALARAEEYAGVDGPRTPADFFRVLQRAGGIVVGQINALQARVELLTDVRYPSMLGTEQVRGEVTLLGQAIDRAARLVKLIADLDLDTRIAGIARAQGELVAVAVRRALDEGNLTHEQRNVIEARLAVEFRAVTLDEEC